MIMNYWWMIKDRGCILKPRHLPKVVAVWACPGAQSIGRAWPWRLFWRQASGTRPWGPVGGRHWRLKTCSLSMCSLNLFESLWGLGHGLAQNHKRKRKDTFMPFHATIPYPVRKMNFWIKVWTQTSLKKDNARYVEASSPKVSFTSIFDSLLV